MSDEIIELIGVALDEIGAPSIPQLKQVQEKVKEATQEQLDAAWATRQKAIDEKKAKDAEIAKAAAANNKVKGVKYTEVENLHRSTLHINGVDIPVGGKAEVPNFDPKKPLMAAWLKAKCIKA